MTTMDRIERDLRLARWMVALNIAGSAAMLWLVARLAF